MLSARCTMIAAIVLPLVATPPLALSAQSSDYHVVKHTVLGHVRADYLIVDPVGRRLLGMGDSVLDVDKDTVVGTVEGGGGGYAIASDEESVASSATA